MISTPSGSLGQSLRFVLLVPVMRTLSCWKRKWLADARQVSFDVKRNELLLACVERFEITPPCPLVSRLADVTNVSVSYKRTS